MQQGDIYQSLTSLLQLVRKTEAKDLISSDDLTTIGTHIEEIIEGYGAFTKDLIDIRDYCANYGQALCITDKSGVITYLNSEYEQKTGLTAISALGKPEEFRDPVSLKVIKNCKTVRLGNDGSRLGLDQGRFVVGVPIFDQQNHLRNIVITLSTEDSIYSQYSELKRVMSAKEPIHIVDSAEAEAFSNLHGKNAKIQELRGLIKKVASTDATVLVTGESGVGKELVSDCIYNLSKRKGKAYVKINCAAIPPSLLEAELFGYEGGAFTGANPKGKTGLFETANHGTILLDEIGDFPLELQPKLLRVLQQGELYRIGSNTPTQLDVRVIAATNSNLKKKMQEGKFREDLYYRLSVIPIYMPPLRERVEDISRLAKFFLEKYCEKYCRSVYLSRSVQQALEEYDWPGNVRELQNIIEYYVICSDEGNDMDSEKLRSILNSNRKNEIGTSLFEMRDNYERHLIEEALKKTSSARKAAQMLGIYPSSLYRKCKKYNLYVAEEDEKGS